PDAPAIMFKTLRNTIGRIWASRRRVVHRLARARQTPGWTPAASRPRPLSAGAAPKPHREGPTALAGPVAPPRRDEAPARAHRLDRRVVEERRSRRRANAH